MKKISLILFLGFSLFFLFGCQEESPSILKIFVRSNDAVLVNNASVRIVGDSSMDTPQYIDEAKTNSSGYAIFNLDELFNGYGDKEAKVAYFTVYARDSSAVYTVGKARAKANMTYTATINLKE